MSISATCSAADRTSAIFTTRTAATDYERVRATEYFRRGLERLMRGLERHAVAMMCCEDDPLDCHRGLMITPAVKEAGLSPLHLRKDGSVETTEAMERRLSRDGPGGAGGESVVRPTADRRRPARGAGGGVSADGAAEGVSVGGGVSWLRSGNRHTPCHKKVRFVVLLRVRDRDGRIENDESAFVV